MSAQDSSSSSSPRSAGKILTSGAQIVAPAIDTTVATLPELLLDPIRHHLAGGGKFVRATLALLSGAAVGAGNDTSLPAAVAVELVHNYSLIHDDIMDGDQERRHRPTVWAQFGVGTAIIAGDCLATLAIEVLLDDPRPRAAACATLLGKATQRMIAGQAADLALENRELFSVEECIAMESQKTGALIGCATEMGATFAGGKPEAVAALKAFGEHVGQSFQAIDDVLGIWGDPEVTGKPVGADLIAGKRSLPVAAAMANAGDRSHNLLALLGGEMDGERIIATMNLIEDCGGRQQAIDIADFHFRRAVDHLRSADLEEPAAGELEVLAAFVCKRDH